MTRHNAISAKNTAHAPQGAGACSQSVAFSHYNNLSAQLPIDPATGQLVAGGAHAQASQCLANIKAVLASMGHAMDDVVRLTVFVTHLADLTAVEEALASHYTAYRPTRTSAAVAALPLGALVQIEALVSHGEGSIPDAPQAGDLVKVARNTPNAPTSAVSTQTVAFSHYNNLTAQLPIDPTTGALVAGGAEQQAAQCFNNIHAILDSIGHVMNDVVRITLFATNLADLDVAKQVYQARFPTYMPALTTVAVAGLPLNALVQVEAVVSHGDGTPPQPVEDTRFIVIKAHSTDKAPQGPYSQTVAFSHYNHIAAQLPLDPQTGQLVAGGVAEQAAQCLSNIQAVVESIGHRLADTVKVNMALTNLADMAAVEAVYAQYFPGGVPARRTIGVAALPGGALVQMDAVLSNAEGTPPQA